MFQRKAPFGKRGFHFSICNAADVLLRRLLERLCIHSRIELCLCNLDPAGVFSVLLVLADARKRDAVGRLPVFEISFAFYWAGLAHGWINFAQNTPVLRIDEPAHGHAFSLDVEDLRIDTADFFAAVGGEYESRVVHVLAYIN